MGNLQGRSAREGRLNKTGQSWRSIIEKEYDEDGNVKSIKDCGPFACPECKEIVRYDHRGWACCNCRIWNDVEKRPIPKNSNYNLNKILRKVS